MALTDNLLAFYKLNDLTDSSGNNRTLTNNGNVSFASGKIGNAATCIDGSFLEISNFSALSNASEYTATCWAKPYYDSASGTFYCVGQTGGDSEPQIVIAYAAGVSAHALNKTNSGFQYIDVPMNDVASWNHFALSVNSNSAKFYINGNLVWVGTEGGASMPSDVSLILGKHSYWGDVPNVDIDAAGIWNRALSDSEVAALYNSGTGLELPAPAGSPTQSFIKIEDKAKFFGKVKFVS